VKRLALAAVAALAFAVLAAPAASENTTHHHTRPEARCLLGSFEVFSGRVWRPARWRRGAPPASTIAAAHARIGCAPTASHRKAMKATWRRDRAAYYQRRHYRLRWGRCTDAGPITDCIHGAALTYGADEGWMLAVMYCESTGNRYAHNASGAESWFQFLPSTWETTPYGGRDITSAKWQSLAAAWMDVVGRSGEWVCQG
jgi:hypothetical protein